MPRPLYDVIGLGANSFDHVYRLPTYPFPNGPWEKLRISSQIESCGGQTATTLCACAALGRSAKYIGAFGQDDKATRIREALTARGVDTRNTVTRSCPNAYAVILLAEADGERVVLWHRDRELALSDTERCPDLVTRARLLHVDDVDEESAIAVARLASEAGVTVTCDIDRVTPRTSELVAAVTSPIFAQHVPQALTGESDVERALRKLRRHHDGTLCVTLGARGATMLEGDKLHHVPAFKVDVVDTTGAGDVFRGAFIYALLRGDMGADLLRFANAAAAVSCTRLGAIDSVPTLKEVETMMAAKTNV